MQTTTIRQRLFNTDRVQAMDNGCWLWLGATNSNGYGQIREKVDGKWTMLLVHRVSYELLVGPIPEGLNLLHSCDTPNCCNPEHLRPGTHLENMQDAKDRGRMRGKVGGVVLTEDDVRHIRCLLAGKEKHKRIAEQMGVCRSLITLIATGRRYGEIL